MKQHVRIPADLSHLSLLRERVNSFIDEGLDDIEKARVILAIDEAVANVIIHGYNNDNSNSVDIEMESSPEQFTFIISDKAPEFNPVKCSSPDIDLYQENGLSGGLGIDLYKKILNTRYEKDQNGGNRLILIKEKKHENQPNTVK